MRAWWNLMLPVNRVFVVGGAVLILIDVAVIALLATGVIGTVAGVLVMLLLFLVQMLGLIPYGVIARRQQLDEIARRVAAEDEAAEAARRG